MELQCTGIWNPKCRDYFTKRSVGCCWLWQFCGLFISKSREDVSQAWMRHKCWESFSLVHKNVKQSSNMPGVAQRVPCGLDSQISMTFDTWSWWGCQPHAPAAFTPRKCSWYSFSLGAESTPGPWCGRKGICHWKITGNRSRDRPTSSAAP